MAGNTPSGMTAYRSQKEVADLLGISPRQVHNLTDRGMPRQVHEGKPRYPWPDALKWYITFKVAAEAAKTEPIDFEKARARKMTADAELTEMELARARGETVTVDVFRETVSAIATKVRSQLMAAPGRYSSRMVGLKSLPEAQRMLDQMVRDVLNELKE